MLHKLVFINGTQRIPNRWKESWKNFKRCLLLVIKPYGKSLGSNKFPAICHFSAIVSTITCLNKTSNVGIYLMRIKSRDQTSHWRVKQGVSLNYKSLNWPQAGEALTHSRIQMWWSQGWGPLAPPDPRVESRQAGPAVSRRCGAVSVWPVRGRSSRRNLYTIKNTHHHFSLIWRYCNSLPLKKWKK